MGLEVWTMAVDTFVFASMVWAAAWVFSR